MSFNYNSICESLLRKYMRCFSLAFFQRERIIVFFSEVFFSRWICNLYVLQRKQKQFKYLAITVTITTVSRISHGTRNKGRILFLQIPQIDKLKTPQLRGMVWRYKTDHCTERIPNLFLAPRKNKYVFNHVSNILSNLFKIYYIDTTLQEHKHPP